VLAPVTQVVNNGWMWFRRRCCAATKLVLPAVIVVAWIGSAGAEGGAAGEPADGGAATTETGAAPAPTRCMTLRYVFQAECFDPPCAPIKRKLGNRLDLGPQVAVWVEAVDRSRFHDTLMVTNLTARHGVGNRPGLWNMPSGPKQPYGKRLNVLPVWAWARGKLYPQVVMQDGHDEWMGFHEQISTPDPYYCRPMGLAEVDVDAITCPTKVFNSAKGRLAPELPQIPYPPRNDLMQFNERDCDSPASQGQTCARSAETFRDLNDLDAVAAATPTFDQAFEGRWTVGADLPLDVDYALLVEVNREFDQNAQHRYPAYNDKMLSDNGFTQTGLPNNLGQPSVVYRVPFRIDGTRSLGTTAAIAGYGAPDGTTGTLRAPDSSISQTPGSGEGRLRTIAPPWTDGEAAQLGAGKVFLRLEGCGAQGGMGNEGACQVRPPAPPAVTDMEVMDQAATTAIIRFRHAGDDGAPVLSYDIRLHHGHVATEENFIEGVPLTRVEPGAPGTMASFTVRELKPNSEYVVAVRSVGRCGTLSNMVQVPVTTKDQQFTMLTGCFVATAAYGSALAPAVDAMRAVRDRARASSAVAAAVTDLYERSSPPVADLLRQSDGLRAVVRTLLGPAARLAGAAAGAQKPR
jgi:hypothetical protein